MRTRIHNSVYNVFSIGSQTWFLLVFLLLSWFAFTRVDQAADSVSHIIVQNNPWRIGSMYACMTLFALAVWYAARIMLMLTSIQYINARSALFMVRWIPRFLGLLAFSGPFGLLVSMVRDPDGMFLISSLATGHLGLLTGCAAGYMVFVITRRRKASLLLLRPADRKFKDLPGHVQMTLRVLPVLAIGVVVFFCFRGPAAAMARLTGPVNIITLALAVYSLLGMTLLYMQKKWRLPLALMVGIMVIGFSYINNNHAIRLIPGIQAHRPPVDSAFAQWIELRPQVKDTLHVFIVAAEGGGIRAACFTALTLAKLDSAHPGFTGHVFAISSVSGGSLGAVVFNAMKADRADRLTTKVLSFFKQDFLAPLNAAFVFPDLVQKFIPYPIRRFDRAQWLEDAWSEAYADETGLHSLDSSFALFNRGNAGPVPYLFVNSTMVESGQKAVHGPLRLDTVYFKGDVDLAEMIRAPVALKTIASVSSRFPFITPAAVVTDPTTSRAYHFVDGGYADNSGLGTAISIAGALNHMKYDSAWKLPPFRVHVILLKNSLGAGRQGPVKPLRGMYETGSVISAFYNAWDNSVNRVIKSARSYFYFNREGGELISLELNRSTGILPLGWDLSDRAMEHIVYSADSIVDNQSVIRKLLY